MLSGVHIPSRLFHITKNSTSNFNPYQVKFLVCVSYSTVSCVIKICTVRPRCLKLFWSLLRMQECLAFPRKLDFVAWVSSSNILLNILPVEWCDKSRWLLPLYYWCKIAFFKPPFSSKNTRCVTNSACLSQYGLPPFPFCLDFAKMCLHERWGKGRRGKEAKIGWNRQQARVSNSLEISLLIMCYKSTQF